MGIEYIRVTQENVEDAIALTQSIFKETDHYAIRQELVASVGLQPETQEVLDVMEIHRAGYVMAMLEGKPAGVSGYYSHVGHEEDVWLGWTGVSSQFGGCGIGEAIVKAAFDIAKFDGVKNLRIWTSNEDQFAAARRLYSRMGFVEEEYDARSLPSEGKSLVRVFSKAANPFTRANRWVENSYRLPDLEVFDMPRLDKLATERETFGSFQSLVQKIA